MYAIVDIAGQQFKVRENQEVFVHRLENKEGDKVSFDKVFLLENNGKIDVGMPFVSGLTVTAKVIEHLKGDKVIVFKKKRRKGYRVKNGHRQSLTKLEIQKIAFKGKESTEKKATAKKATAKKATAKKATAKKTDNKS